MSRTLVDRIVARCRPVLQPVGEWLHQGVAAGVSGGGESAQAGKDAMNGVWLGHPLHPALVGVPLGAWSSATVLDLADLGRGGGQGRSADLLIAVGCLGAVGAAASGLADWQDKYGHERDIGTAHALLNSAALSLFLASLTLRLRGQRRPGVALSLAGMGLASASAYLGGDLVYRLGIQVNRNAFTEGPLKWREAADDSEVKEGELTSKEVSGNKVVLTRLKGRICVLSAVCSHSGGPLDKEPIKDGQLSCPWHGSRFDLFTGEVTHGPASIAAPTYEARVVDGKVEIRRPKG